MKLRFSARHLKRACAGLEPFRAFPLIYLDHLVDAITGKRSKWHERVCLKHFRTKFRKPDYYQIGEVRLPLLDKEDETLFFSCIFGDVFAFYFHWNDCYDEQNVKKYETLLDEGPYCFKNTYVDVRVCKEDIVIDAGSWIGDFAAYASVKGATTYAFEPTPSTFEYLCKTAELNPNIIPIRQCLGDKKSFATVSQNDAGNTGRNTVIPNETQCGCGGVPEQNAAILMTTIDAFVREQNLPRVDFIKADIEGYERHMLAGARETLARFAPKLAICTYHLPDDPEVLENLIREANPAYKVVQMRKKLYASV